MPYGPPSGETCIIMPDEDNPELGLECFCIDTSLPKENMSYSMPDYYCFNRPNVSLDYKKELEEWAEENRVKRIQAENELKILRGE